MVFIKSNRIKKNIQIFNFRSEISSDFPIRLLPAGQFVGEKIKYKEITRFQQNYKSIGIGHGCNLDKYAIVYGP